MKLAVFALVASASCALFAKSEPSIGRYAAGVRDRVVRTIRKTLNEDGGAAEVTGVVTFSADGRFFLQNGDDGLKVQCGGKRPSVGERVVVSGSPSLEGGRVIFLSRGWKSLGREGIPAARPATTQDLVYSGDMGSINGLWVVVEGRAIGTTESGFAINIDGAPVNIVVAPLPEFLDNCDRTHPVVSVTGVAELMLDQSVLFGDNAYVMGVKINVAGPEAVVLKPDLVYLAAKRDRTLSLAVGALLTLLAGGLLVFAVVVFRQRRRLFRTRTIMAERKRMAEDIHDTIEQHLVGAGMLLKINRLKEAQDVLVRAKREIRDIVWGLKNDDMMRLSPAEMIRQLAHEENTKGIYRVDTRLEGLPEVLDAAAMRDLSLIIRESIGNAVKHGGAKKIAISSDARPNGSWRLRISNDGAPFDPATAPGAKEGHFGLEGMRQRARRLGATVSFEPRRGNGMVLILEKGI